MFNDAHSYETLFSSVPEDFSDDDNDYGEEEEDDDGGDSDYETKKISKGRQATAKRKRAAGTTYNCSCLIYMLFSENKINVLFTSTVMNLVRGHAK